MQWHLSTVHRNRRQPGKYYSNLVARLGTGQSRLQIATEVKDFISSKMCRLWGPPSPLFNGYWSSLGIWGVRITTHLSPMLRLQMRAADLPLSIHALMVCIRTTLLFTRNGNGTHRMRRFDFYKCRGLLLGGPLGRTLDSVSGHSDSGCSCSSRYRQLWLYQDSRGWSRKVLRGLGRFKQLDVLSGGLLRGGYLKRRLYSSCRCRVTWPQNCPLKVLYIYKHYVNTG